MSLTKDVKFGPDWILLVDASVNKSFPVASRWRYDYNAILAFRCSGQDSYQTCEVWGRSDILWLVTTTSIPMARHQFVATRDTPFSETQDLHYLTSKAFRLD